MNATSRIRSSSYRPKPLVAGLAMMKATGYAFARDTPKIYGLGTHTCSDLRDEAVDGDVAAVYREQYRSDVGATDATTWISQTSGRVLREEQDGDIGGKDKGHITYRWPSVKP